MCFYWYHKKWGGVPWCKVSQNQRYKLDDTITPFLYLLMVRHFYQSLVKKSILEKNTSSSLFFVELRLWIITCSLKFDKTQKIIFGQRFVEVGFMKSNLVVWMYAPQFFSNLELPCHRTHLCAPLMEVKSFFVKFKLSCGQYYLKRMKKA